MSNLSRLDDKLLVHSYLQAIKLNLHPNFISLLAKEMEDRQISSQICLPSKIISAK
ncbi:sporulation histidine kinase inhibitor Sda [Niallia sp. JL1B1071]|uniref:sporulation histidine kinase inhibitor Sda n=1 Tax=Niallia tiangongensis TaxID=3237105 RepID=UPI0037DCE8A1